MTAIPSSSYGYGSLASDPYWLYLQSQAQQQIVQPQDNTKVSLPQASSSIAMKGNVQRAPEEEVVVETGSSGLEKALKIGGTLLAIGATCVIAKGKSGTNWFSGERWKTGWNAIKSDWFGIGKKATEKAAENIDDLTHRAITGRKVGEEWVISIPSKKQVLKGADATTKAKNLGLNVNEALAWTDDAAKLDSGWINFEYNGQKSKAFYKNGEIRKVFNEKGKELTIADTLKEETQKITDAIKAKKLPDGMTLTNARYSTVVEGSTVSYTSDFANKTRNGLNKISTNRHYASDDIVQAYADGQSDFSKCLKQLTDKKPNYEGWSIGHATYKPKELPANTEIVVKEGAVCGVNAPNQYGKIEFFGLESEKYKALHNQYTALFDDAMKNQDKFQNVVYSHPF